MEGEETGAGRAYGHTPLRLGQEREGGLAPLVPVPLMPGSVLAIRYKHWNFFVLPAPLRRATRISYRQIRLTTSVQGPGPWAPMLRSLK